MKTILVLGAGRSTTTLIEYLTRQCEKHRWRIRVGDYRLDFAVEKCQGSPVAEPFQFDIRDRQQWERELDNAAIVISMLPASFHHRVAEGCVETGVPMVTASYLSREMTALHAKATSKGILLLNECGLDPGIDHMSAMQVIDKISASGGRLTALESFTGGLLAPGTDDANPWEYKFTWNPGNVVRAGQGTVKFIQQGQYKYIPYHRLFTRTEPLHVAGYGDFEGYANRDSLKYLDIYGLRDISTIYRGTLRRPGFCRSWNIFVQLGATDDTYEIEGIAGMTHRDFMNAFLPYNPHDSVELKLAHYMGLEPEGSEMHRLRWAGVFDREKVGLEKGTPAQILEHILKKKWTLTPEDKDMIVMLHKFEYLEGGIRKKIDSTLIALGGDADNTAMAKTVGLPVAIAASLILTGKITETGVHIPIKKTIYEPILKALGTLGFEMRERKVL